jgi:hypothetical protein
VGRGIEGKRKKIEERKERIEIARKKEERKRGKNHTILTITFSPL